jgi:hypothetical protein
MPVQEVQEVQEVQNRRSLCLSKKLEVQNRRSLCLSKKFKKFMPVQEVQEVKKLEVLARLLEPTLPPPVETPTHLQLMDEPVANVSRIVSD